MTSRSQLFLLSGILIATGLGLALYKNMAFGFPLTQAGSEDVWTVEAEISFVGEGQPARVSLALPRTSQDFMVLQEGFASPGYGFERREAVGGERAEWTRRNADAQQSLFYRVQLARRMGEFETQVESAPPAPPPPFFDQAQRTAAHRLIQVARSRSADARSFTVQLLALLNLPNSDQNAEMLLRQVGDSEGRVQLVRQLVALEAIPSRLTRGVLLEEGRRFQPMVPGLEIWVPESGWLYFDVASGREGKPPNLFLWQRGGVSLLDVEGGQNSQVRFSILRESRPVTNLARQRAEASEAALLNFSIYELPIEDQNVFKRLMLVPIGCLVIVILRNLVGMATSGTFMPILLALAFQETRLIPGIVLFLIIVSSGLAIRSLLSHLNLLVVARVSAVVIVVIGLMALLSIISHKLDLPVGLKVTFFPMIIIAWTIERLSILWEEEGARSAILQGGGSLVVAVIAYLFMTFPWVRYLTYTFPELLLVILALALLLGNYSGYRLTELRRFLPFVAKV